MERCVVLNGDYSFLNTVNWKRAICLIIKEKAEMLKASTRTVQNCEGTVCFQVPLVIKLIKVVRLIYKNKVPFSKRNIMVRDGFRCVYCGNRSRLTIDHVIPASQGGKNNFENCVTACQPCNNKKGNRTPREANMFMKKQPHAPTISEFIRMKMKQLGVEKFLKELGVY
jgi:5-methylcytosine-specific restriction endonuclease McrA